MATRYSQKSLRLGSNKTSPYQGIIVIIPARGGSKGIPRKNIHPLCGKPLIFYSIKAALEAKCIERIICSTDDTEIANIAKKFGAEVPFMRPAELATDTAPSLAVLQHAVDYLEKNESYFPKTIVELLPTAPLRTAFDINEAIRLFFDSNADTTIGIVKVKQHPYWVMKVNEKGEVTPFYSDYEKFTRRQDLPPLFFIAGTITVIKRDILMAKRGGLIFGGKMTGYIMPTERCINIDSWLDLKLAELLLKENLKSECNSR